MRSLPPEGWAADQGSSHLVNAPKAHTLDGDRNGQAGAAMRGRDNLAGTDPSPEASTVANQRLGVR